MNSRFFCPQPLAPDSLVELPPAAAHHARRVLRLRLGAAVTLFDGEGGEYPGHIAEVGRAVRVRLGGRLDVERESPLDITLAQALAAGDKMDFVVQKAVELGVARIQPLLASRSVLRLSGERAVCRPRELAGRRFLLLVGPEGGLAEEEAAAAGRAGFAGLSLGPRILRTETAGPAALAALGALHGDL